MYKPEERFALLKGYALALRKLLQVMARRFYERQYSLCTDKEVFSKPLQSYNLLQKKNKFTYKIGNRSNTILIITPFLPYPLRSGGQVKMYNTLKKLSQKYDIILFSFIENYEQEQYIPELNKLCKRVFTVLRRPSCHTLFNKFNLPIFIKYFYSREMEEKLKQCLKDYRIDLVQIEYINMAYYSTFITNIPKILVEHDTSIYTLNKSCEKPVFGKFFQFF